MARSRPNPDPPAPDDGAEDSGRKISSLKVQQEDQQIIAKVAAMRNVSIEKLFTQLDVRTFFKHLLLAEMKKEAERLQGPQKP